MARHFGAPSTMPVTAAMFNHFLVDAIGAYSALDRPAAVGDSLKQLLSEGAAAFGNSALAVYAQSYTGDLRTGYSNSASAPRRSAGMGRGYEVFDVVVGVGVVGPLIALV